GTRNDLPESLGLRIGRRKQGLVRLGALVLAAVGPLGFGVVVGNAIAEAGLAATVKWVKARHVIERLTLGGRHQWLARDVMTDLEVWRHEILISERRVHTLVAREDASDLAGRIVARIRIKSLAAIRPLPCRVVFPR